MEQNNSQSWKTPYLIGLTIVTVICIIAGIAFRMYGSGLRKTSKKDLMKTDEMTVVKTDKFEDMDINLAVGDLEIVYGDDYMVSYNYPAKIEPNVKSENGKLVITQNSKMNNISLLNFDGLKSLKDMDYDIVITIPNDTKLSDVSLNLDMGEITFADITMEDLTIDADMGNVEISKSTMKNVSVDADMGNVELTDLIFDKAECDADMGNIEIKGSTFDKAECDADMGSIQIAGDFNEVTANCSMGSVSVDTKKDIDDVKLDLSADMGSVTVNGKSKGNEFSN